MITVYFDGDQTLWDFQALMRRSLSATIEELRSHVPGVSGDLTVDAFVADRAEVAEALRGLTWNLEEIRLEAFRASLRRLGLANDSLAQHLNGFYLARRFAGVDLYDDVIPTLRALAGRCQVGLLSNGNSYPDGVGLENYFADHRVLTGRWRRETGPTHLRCGRESASGTSLRHGR
jgi:FMN phosphatase YigB (HAD superfamily)